MSRQSYPFDPGRPLDLISMGRVAVDFYAEQIGAPLEAAQSFRMYLGGCAGNIAVGSSRLGLKTSMFSRVGSDDLGLFLRRTLEKEGVDTRLLIDDPDHLTALVVLGVEPPDRFPLIFFRESCADMETRAEDADEEIFQQSKALLITGTGLSQESMRTATHRSIDLAKRSGAAVIMDVDYRPVLWNLTSKGDGETRYIEDNIVTEELEKVIPKVDLLVGTEAEILIAAGSDNVKEAVERLRASTPATFVLKRGERGCTVYPAGAEPISETPAPVPVLNVVGAGDAFMSGFLRGWLRGEDYATCARWANGCGALVVSRHGCAPAMPSFDELQFFLSNECQAEALSDPELARLHRRANLGPAPALQILAFDHRRQLEQTCREAARSADLISDFKELVFEGFQRSLADHVVGNPAILVDRQYGARILEASARGPFAVGSPIERSGSFPVEWAEDKSLYSQLLERDPRHFVKVLVHFHPTLEHKERQIRQLRQLANVCDELERRLMLELIIPADCPQSGASLASSIEALYVEGVFPSWWKIDAVESAEQWRLITDILDRYDDGARVVILGKSAPMEEFEHWFEIARSSHHCVGFAVGRTLFWQAWLDYVHGEIEATEVPGIISERYRTLIDLWDRAASVPAAGRSTA